MLENERGKYSLKRLEKMLPLFSFTIVTTFTSLFPFQLSMSTNLTRRMTSSDRPYSNSINNNVENNEMDEETLSNQVTNPLRPSNAYMESLRKAQTSERGNNASLGYIKRPGKKTIATALFLFVGGLILFIIGAVYFWNSSDFHTLQGITQAQGFDMLIAGSISKFMTIVVLYPYLLMGHFCIHTSISLTLFSFFTFLSAATGELCLYRFVWRMEEMAWI